MPARDGTGPLEGGARPGRGRERAGGRGRNRGNFPGSGPGGNCLCPECQHRVPHQRGVPCYKVKCPKCGAAMMKE